MTLWIKVRSWHVAAINLTGTLCGLTVKPHPDRQAGEHQAAGWSETLPAGKSCEACLRIMARRIVIDGSGTFVMDIGDDQ